MPICKSKKKCYGTEETAESVRKSLNKKHQKKNGSQKPGHNSRKLTASYQCLTCGFWHLTSRVQRED